MKKINALLKTSLVVIGLILASFVVDDSAIRIMNSENSPELGKCEVKGKCRVKNCGCERFNGWGTKDGGEFPCLTCGHWAWEH